MIEFWSYLGRFALAHLWLPTLGWTFAAAMGWWWIRRRPDAHPLLRYRWNQALLFALPAALAAGLILPLGQLPGWGPGDDGPRETAPTANDVVVAERIPPAVATGPLVVPRDWTNRQGVADLRAGPGVPPVVAERGESLRESPEAAPSTLEPAAVGRDADGPDFAVLTTALLGLITLAWWIAAMVRIGALVAGLGNLRRIAATTRPVAAPDVESELTRLKARLALRMPIRLVRGPDDSVPMTFGLLRPTVSLPGPILEHPRERRMSLVHELIHVARRDFAWSFAEHLVRALFPWHTLARRLAADIERDREASCDLEVLNTGEAEPRSYASLLYSFGAAGGPTPGVAPALSPTPSQLRMRIESMRNFPTKPGSPTPRRRSALAALAILVSTAALGACFSFERGTVVEEQPQPTTEFLVQRVEGTVDALERSLARLDAQISYLSEEIDAMEAERRQWAEAWEAGERYELSRRVETRYGLLGDMYEERIREYEMLKLELVAASVSR